MQSIPVTVLTGFLGAGKTTLLNRILTEKHGLRIAVIENEFGEVGIDNELVVNAEEEIFEMNNGCICCTVRGDLIRILGNLAKRRQAFDYVLVETTGLADPGPVAQTFFMDEEVKAHYRLDGIVTVVDAKHAWQHWNDSREFQEQIAFADRILVNKVDLVSRSEVDRLIAKLRSVNRVAEVIQGQRGQFPLDSLLNVHAFDLTAKLELEPDFLKASDGHDDHTHDSEISSVGIKESRPMDQKKFETWIGGLVQSKGQDLFRMKGILNVQGNPKRFVVQGVHMQLEGLYDRDWRTREERQSTFVFIGRNLDRQALTSGFQSCVV